MKSKLKKIVVPIFLAVFCGFLCGRLMFNIYEEKGSSTLNSNVIYLLLDTSYNNYEDKGKYNVVVALTKNEDNISKIEELYNKKLTINKYLINDEEIINKLNEYDEKLSNSTNNDEIKDIIKNMNSIYKDKEDIKMVKIS